MCSNRADEKHVAGKGRSPGATTCKNFARPYAFLMHGGVALLVRGGVMARMFWVNKKNYQKLETIGKKKGGLKPTQLVRAAIQEYIDRESETKKKAKRDKTRKPKR